MAKMIPAIIPKQTESMAERQLFSVLRDGVDNNFTIFHSFKLLTKNRERKFIDGEIDFLVFSPRSEFVVLEVKGGSLIYDGQHGIWYQNDKPLRIGPFE